jgi:hypothetical protein
METTLDYMGHLAGATFEMTALKYNLPTSMSDVYIMQHWQSTDQRLAAWINLPHTENAYVNVPEQLELRRRERTDEIDTRFGVGGQLPESLHNLSLAVGRTY